MGRFIAKIVKNQDIELYKISDKYIINCDAQRNNNNIDQKFLTYLKSGIYISILLDTAKDIFSDKRISSEETLVSDGKWVWSADLIHYYESHRFMWPQEFVNDAQRRSFQLEQLNDIELFNLEAICFDIGRTVFDEKGISSSDEINNSPIRQYKIMVL